ncbi:MAG: phage portal protein [Thiotrichaceae bacterium]
MGIIKNVFGKTTAKFHQAMSFAQQWLADIEINRKSRLHDTLQREYRDSPIATVCGGLIVKSVVDLPWQIGRLDKGIFKETPNSALAKLINKPNAQQTRDTFFSKTIQNMLISGEAYILPSDSKGGREGKPQNLYSISSKGVRPHEGSIEGQVAKLVYTSIKGTSEDLSPKEMLFLRFALDPVDQFRGVGPMQPAVLSVATSRKNITWINRLAHNFGIPPAVLRYGDENFRSIMQEEMQAALLETWKEKVIKNPGMPFVTTAEVKPLSFSPVEASVVAMLDVSELQVAKAFNVPPILAGDLRFSSFANAREATTNFTLKNVLPLGWALAKGLTQWLQPWFPGEVIWIEVKDIEVLQEDYKKRTEAIAAQVNAGIISPNTAAIELGYPEQDSDGEKRIVDGTKGPLSGATDELGHGETVE